MFDDNLNLQTESCEIVLCNEPTHDLNSPDNKFTSENEIWLEQAGNDVSSMHSVVLNCRNGESHSCILLAGGGASDVHENSAFIHGEKLLVAVGDFVCCLRLPKLEVEWHTKTDWTDLSLAQTRVLYISQLI